MTQPTLFDVPVPTAKAAAIAQVTAHANPDWLAAASQALLNVARRQPLLTADDVWRELGDHAPLQHEARAIGPVMLKACKAGIIEATDRIQLSALGSGRWKVRVWTSRVFTVTS
jgi:hypothetical protein